MGVSQVSLDAGKISIAAQAVGIGQVGSIVILW
jgi:hypothetical protein